MAFTAFQRAVCALLAAPRLAGGESYVAGGVALNALTGGTRISRDLDLFHDTEEALARTWAADRELLQGHGYTVALARARPGFVEAGVARAGDSVLIQWSRDSAFRFFPLVQHPDLGLTLHPLDLATNKVLALVGRVEVRDWVDTIASHERIQPLGLLAWAAAGKDPGFTPPVIIEEARRTCRYSAAEVAELEFAGPAPDAAALSRTWRAMLTEAEAFLAVLPPAAVGTCVVGPDGELWRESPAALSQALAAARIRFHAGRIRGAWPQLAGAS